MEIFEKMFSDAISNQFSPMHVKILRDQAQKIHSKYLGATGLNLSFTLRKETQNNVSRLLDSDPSTLMKPVFLEAKESILELVFNL